MALRSSRRLLGAIDEVPSVQPEPEAGPAGPSSHIQGHHCGDACLRPHGTQHRSRRGCLWRHRQSRRVVPGRCLARPRRAGPFAGRQTANSRDQPRRDSPSPAFYRGCRRVRRTSFRQQAHSPTDVIGDPERLGPGRSAARCHGLDAHESIVDRRPIGRQRRGALVNNVQVRVDEPNRARVRARGSDGAVEHANGGKRRTVGCVECAYLESPSPPRSR